MKKIAILAVLVLAGCTSPIIDDMVNNDFVGVVAEAPPEEVVGIWTGSMGPYLATMRIGKDGRGVLCSSYASTDSVMDIKYVAGSIKTQTGTPMDIKEVNSEKMTVQTPYFSSPKHHFYNDSDLSKASRFCLDSLKV